MRLNFLGKFLSKSFKYSIRADNSLKSASWRIFSISPTARPTYILATFFNKKRGIMKHNHYLLSATVAMHIISYRKIHQNDWHHQDEENNHNQGNNASR